jgi:hypothetical protein
MASTDLNSCKPYVIYDFYWGAYLKFTSAQQCCVEISCTESHQCRSRITENKGKNLLTPLSTAWLSLSLLPWNSPLFNNSL